MTDYYNTTGAAGAVLTHYRISAASQAGKILKFFRANPGQNYTPSEVHAKLFSDATPLTSTRRAITSLTSKGALRKTHHARTGAYGRLEYAWRWGHRPAQQRLL